jgi:hypothetical protein
MAITEWDEYLIHQIPDTVDAVESVDPHWMDRFFFGCHNAEGTLHLMAGLGTYPNVNIMDGFACVRHNGIQRNIRVSRHLQADRANTQVGPLSFKVLAPLKRWGIYLGDNDYGIRCSLEFEGRAAPYLFPKLGTQVHYNQPGRYTGSITFEGQQFNADGFLGARDRTWGIRHAGTFAALEIYLWIQAQFPSFSLTLLYAELLDGAVRMGTGAILNDDGSVIPIVEVHHRIEFIPGLRAYNKMEMLLKDAHGEERHVIAKPISPESYMSGCGYDDRHGLDMGPFHVEGERWDDVSQPVAIDSPLFATHHQQNQRDAEFQLDGESGVGLIEASFSREETWQYKPSWQL